MKRINLGQPCKVEDCNRKSYVRGWCQRHYYRWWKHGDPLKTKKNIGPVTWEYLLSCSIPNKKTGCIEWQKGGGGEYGSVQFNGKRERVNRVSYRLNVGEIPDGLFVCHHCDNPPCINPDHLFLGTQTDNMRDMASKGRSALGERNGQSKLTEKDIISIREMNGSYEQIAKLFCVDPSNISCIRSRKTWRHI